MFVSLLFPESFKKRFSLHLNTRAGISDPIKEEAQQLHALLPQSKDLKQFDCDFLRMPYLNVTYLDETSTQYGRLMTELDGEAAPNALSSDDFLTSISDSELSANGQSLRQNMTNYFTQFGVRDIASTLSYAMSNVQGLTTRLNQHLPGAHFITINNSSSITLTEIVKFSSICAPTDEEQTDFIQHPCGYALEMKSHITFNTEGTVIDVQEMRFNFDTQADSSLFKQLYHFKDFSLQQLSSWMVRSFPLLFSLAEQALTPLQDKDLSLKTMSFGFDSKQSREYLLFLDKAQEAVMNNIVMEDLTIDDEKEGEHTIDDRSYVSILRKKP